jgi:FMN-dependent NADH-azoreductase
MNLLHIDSSALGSHSVSRQLTAAIAARLQREQPGSTLVYRDLAVRSLAHWTPVTDAADPAVREGSAALDEFLAADVIVIGAPMYNFGIPSQLKAWIDRIVVAGKTFQYSANGPEGLAKGKRVIVASTRGGVYDGHPEMDFQEAYLRHVLGFIGVTDVEFVRAEGLNLGAESKASAIDRAHVLIDGGLLKAA